MAKCWEKRGCDEEMQSNCAHHVEFEDNCPTKCVFANCSRKTHVMASEPEVLFDTTVDRSQARRDICMLCEFFLKNGPKLGGPEVDDPKVA